MKNRKATCGWKPENLESKRRRQARWYEQDRLRVAHGDFYSCAVSFFRCHKKQDAKKNQMFDLDVPWICEKIALPCVYCGENKKRRTLDRIDNAVGHTKENCVTACVRCNLIRGNMPFSAWQALVPVVRSVAESGLFGDWSPRRLVA